MYFKTSFLAAAAAVGSALAHDVKTSTSVTASTYLGGLNLYWGQYGLPDDRLSAYCDAPGVTSVSLSFVTYSPKFGGGLPGTNFAGHCGGEVFYKNPLTGLFTKLVMNCDFIKQDIKYCRNKGVKVLLSVGGQCDTSLTGGMGCPYDVDTDQEGEEFGNLLHKMFGPFDASWNGPRPFDISATEHNAVDGFDIDLEFKYSNFSPYIKMVEKLRSCANYYISAAPQCPTADQWFQMKALIYAVKFDALFIQFYNNPGCQMSDTPNYDDWEVVLSQTSQSKDARLYIGVLASPAAGWAGYVPPSTVQDLICKVKSKAHFGGVSVWDATRGGLNLIGGQAFHVAIADALRYGCDAIPSTNASISASASASAAASASASAAASVSVSASASVSGSASVAASASVSASDSASSSGNAPTASATNAFNVSVSASDSAAASGSASATNAFNVSVSASVTAAASGSASATNAFNVSVSASITAAASDSASATNAFNGSVSASVTAAASDSAAATIIMSSAPVSASGFISATGSVPGRFLNSTVVNSASASATDVCEEDDDVFPSATPTKIATVSASGFISASGSVPGKFLNSTVVNSASASATDVCEEDDDGFPSATPTKIATVSAASGSVTSAATGSSPSGSNGAASVSATGTLTVTPFLTGSASASVTGSGSGASASGSVVASATTKAAPTGSDVANGTDMPAPTPGGSDINSASGSAKPIATGPLSVTGFISDKATGTAATSGQASATGSGSGLESGSGGSASGSAGAGTNLSLPTPVGTGGSNPASESAKPVVTGSVSPGPVTDVAQNTAAASQAMTVSTVFTTSVYTVISCAPTVTNCPVGQVTTKVVPWYTTVCPVAAATPGPSEPSQKVSTPGDVYQPPKVTGGNSPETSPGQGANKVVAQPSGSAPKVNGDVPQATGPAGGQVVAQPSGSAPKVNGDVPKATGPGGGQGGSQSSGGAASPKPTATPVGPSDKCTGANCSNNGGGNGGNNGGNNGKDLTTTLRTTLTIPVTAVVKTNSTIAATLPGTGSPSKPTSGTPVPSKPVQAGAGKVGAVGFAGFAAVAAVFLL